MYLFNEKDFSPLIIKCLKLLTHSKCKSYKQYILDLKDNPIVRKVKLADLEHNSNTTRLNRITILDKIRIRKYAKAIKELNK